MIQPQELRIGNNVNTELGIAEVIGIYEDVVDVKGVSVIDNSSENKISISTRSFEGCVEHEKIQQIPLTEEILLKLGFEKREHKSFFKGKELIYFTFTSNKYGFLIWNTIQNKWWVLGKISISQPIYVHQLQNLYFALTGEELTFKK